MVDLTGKFSKLGPCRIMVAGDLMLDSYTIGTASRISPEAPVPVIRVKERSCRPGGAGNVILNLVSLGASVGVIGRIGADDAGRLLKEALIEEGADVQGLVEQSGYVTPVKNRIIAGNQQIVRVDHEEASALPEPLEEQMAAAFPALLEGCALVAISDYGKGSLSPFLIRELIGCAREKKIPVIVDPKGFEYARYSGCRIIKPNLAELYQAAAMEPAAPIEDAAAAVLEKTGAEVLMVTRSEQGISLFYRDGKREDFPVRVREVRDVTGAGDTVLAVLAVAVANHLSPADAACLANIAAGAAIERFGCARISLPDLARRLLEEDAANKVFDEEHLFALGKALAEKPFNVLAVSGKEGLSSELYKAIRSLSHREKDLLVYIRDKEPSSEFVSLMASLSDVDFIVLKGESLRHLCSEISPEEAYLLEGGEVKFLDTVEKLIAMN